MTETKTPHSRNKKLVKKDQAGRELGERALQTRQKFLDATAQLLAERSILDISVTEIARRVDSVSSLFYHYFEDVEDAARQLAQEASAEMPALVTIIDGSWEGSEGLMRSRQLVEAYLDHWERYHAILLLRNHGADRGDKNFFVIRRNALEPLIEKLASLIEGSKATGRVPADIHAYLAASALVSMLEKLSGYTRSLKHFQADRQDLVNTCARMIHTTVCGQP